jgi:hypothetical protein
MSAMAPMALVYIVGLTAGLALGDGPAAPRIALALLWPLGVLAFVVTIFLLITASLVLFPLVGLAAAGAAALWWGLR